MTITEALADIKLIDAKITKQREQIRTYLARSEALKDPLEKDGGSARFIAKTFQSIGDLEERKVGLRRAIALANDKTEVTVAGVTRTISEWLVWRREVAPGRQAFLTQVQQVINAMRHQAAQVGKTATSGGTLVTTPTDIVVNLNEAVLLKEVEQIGDILAALDGQLSLKNATTPVAV